MGKANQLTLDPSIPDVAHILTWNPKYEKISDSSIEQTLRDLEHGSTIIRSWNVGRHTKGFIPGNTVYLLRQGSDRRGIIARGKLITSVYESTFYENPNKSTNFVDYELENIVPVNDRLRIEVLLNYQRSHFKSIDWNSSFRQSGKTLTDSNARALQQLWNNNLDYPRSACPSCGEHAVIQIHYGLPGCHPRDALLEEIVEHAGCVLLRGLNGRCVSCGWSGEAIFRESFRGNAVNTLRVSAKKTPPRKRAKRNHDPVLL